MLYLVPNIEGLEEGDKAHMYDYFEQQKTSKGVIPIEIEYGIFNAKCPATAKKL